MKRLRIAVESLEIYAPIANRLGMGGIKGEIEDLAFPWVNPKSYAETKLLLEKHILVVHGSGFGQKPGSKHFRIVFLPQEEILRNAYAGIREFMQARY